ncbi:trifunctional serine/threonine-protein kinase/ATP-binding protein/sensor histidine kinase [Bradyrhizobium sp. th.b2]|uniref:trifunctional serine/threonine-protein kinase/ATP-binding protein/sensor histidine kinase n=1 Tax=Bradyrhizobium sp. th-b2 TaxID=172088 RepID=UPI0006867DCC|nr:trifunctional serine/threonine-protein kinase/ATP-binding protein/sensor histidine kinase [Bradyrhizobium sp. th.b2]
MNWLSGYAFSLLREGSIALYRGSGNGLAPILLVAAEETSPSCVERLEHEYALKSELDAEWAARPVALTHDSGRITLVLEDPGGTPLDRLLSRPLDVSHFLRIAIPLAGALRHVHERGLIHKDIKPANILVESASSGVWLTGFGIASRVPRERQAPEPPETITGTLAYMAPEQTGRMNRSVDSRSDLYALGVTFYELLTGALPFTAADPIELIHCHIAREPVPPHELASALPAPLSMIVMKLLAKTAEERYQTAAGVEADLRKCLTAWELFGRIDPFPLGLQDASDRLMIPEKLYGREAEIATLLAAFDRVVKHGGSELVLVSGYSGIGKSSVVNELHKVIVLPRGIFISGKFDQRLRDTPHATLAQAFQGLIQQLLNGQANDIAFWRDAIKEAVGNQGRLLTDLIPNLVRLIGPQPTVAVLSPVDAQLRFQTVFQRFVGVFARAEHPLVIFVDDLQWLDPATLTLIEYLLLHPDTRHLLLIGAYRNNEVDPAHPLMLKLEDLRKAGVKVDQIVLGPLSVNDINHLLCDTLRRAPDDMRPFAELVHGRSGGGNPFFAGQFLTSLAEERLIEFDPLSRSWKWDWDAIVDKRFSDNPVDLMIDRLRRLAPEAQEALKLLACLGSHADFATLAKLRGESEEAMHASFRDAVRAGAAAPRVESYRFFHDRVQEAAYALIPAEGRAELHLRIARLLVTETAQENVAEKIYDLVNQLNLGSTLISEWPEKVRAAELNFVAGRKAKASTAYAAASTYLAAGIAVLSDDGWQRSYDLTLGLFLERAECEILNSNLEQAAGLVEVLLIKAGSKIDHAEICRLRIMLQLRQGNYAPAVRTALECLRTFGVDLPDSPTPEQMRAEYEEMRRALGERPIESLVDLPMMDDPEMQAVMKLFSGLGNLAYHADLDLYQMISCWMVKLSCRHGTSEYSAIGYGAVAIVLGPAFHRFADGEAFARLAVAVAERYGFTAQKAGAHFLMQMAVLWTRPIEDALACLEAAIRSVAETGEMVYACWNRQHRLTDLMARGDPLDQVWLESASALDFVRKYKFGQLVILSIQGFVQSLRGGAGSGAPLDEPALEARVLRGGVPLVACFHWILQLQRHFLLGNAERALEFAGKAKPILWSARPNLQSMDYCFYHSLAIAAVFPASSPERRAELREDVISHLGSFQRWADSCPATFAHKHTLISAEWARLEGRDIEAMPLYEQAIRLAAERGFLQDQGLASELAARFYRLRGLEKVADTYLDEARDCYVRWGAWAKVAQLDKSHPRIRQQASLTAKPTIETSIERLDLATVIKMSEAVAGEIVLGRLIETLMTIAVEHTGADRGLLMLPRGGQYQIEAEARSGRDGVRVRLLGTPVTPSELPMLVLEQVIRTEGRVILDDARGENPFAEDEYIGRKQARSLLCLPFLKQAELIGVLYLENSLASHVFTPSRIAVLKLLASQAAIALENARLYSDVAEREAKIRRLVDANIIGIFISSRKGEIIEANDAFLKMMGYDREDIAAGNMHLADLTPPEWRASAARAVVGVDKTGAAQPYEKEYRRKDGSRVPVLMGSAAFDEQQDHGVAFVLDLTERKRAEAEARESERRYREAQLELEHANRVATMGQLTSSIAHEVNQPIAAAVTYASAARRFLSAKPPNFREVDEALSLIVKEGNRAGEVVERVRALIKKVPARKDAVEINDAILEVIALTRTEAANNSVSVQAQLAEGLPPVQGDRVQLQQVLLNLIINAIEAMRDVGEEERQLLISTGAEPGCVSVEVRDSGPGFAAADLERAFEAFYTTKSNGLGLGLSICRSIIEAHNGRLWASPNPQRGAIFRFTAPAHPTGVVSGMPLRIHDVARR